jgi:hypothetical protein
MLDAAQAAIASTGIAQIGQVPVKSRIAPQVLKFSGVVNGTTM